MNIFTEDTGVYPHRSKKSKHNYRTLVTLYSLWGDAKIDVWKQWHSTKESAMRRVEKLKSLLGKDYLYYQILDKHRNLIDTDQVIEKEENNVQI